MSQVENFRNSRLPFSIFFRTSTIRNLFSGKSKFRNSDSLTGWQMCTHCSSKCCQKCHRLTFLTHPTHLKFPAFCSPQGSHSFLQKKKKKKKNFWICKCECRNFWTNHKGNPISFNRSASLSMFGINFWISSTNLSLISWDMPGDIFILTSFTFGFVGNLFFFSDCSKKTNKFTKF